jgi:hypothetical protein
LPSLPRGRRNEFHRVDFLGAVCHFCLPNVDFWPIVLLILKAHFLITTPFFVIAFVELM